MRVSFSSQNLMYTKREDQRREVIILHQHGYTPVQIHRETGRGYKYIRTWIRTYKQTGSLASRKPPGGPPVFTKQQRESVVKIIKQKEEGTSSRKVERQLRAQWESELPLAVLSGGL